MIYAVFDGGVIVGRREILDWDAYWPHKKAARDEKGDGGPTLRPIEYVGEGIEVETTVYDDRVVIRREPAPEPEPVQDDTSAVIAALVAAQQKADAEIARLKSMLASLAEEAVKE